MFTLFKRRKAAIPPWDLSLPVLHWSKHDVLTLGQACMGIQAWGATGSGKTSGSLATLATRFLKLGFGGVFFTVKPTDRAMYERYCHEAGRGDDVIVFGPEQPWRFNFLDAELQRTDAAGGLTENLAGMLISVLEVSERNSGSDGRDEAGFWKRMTRQTLKNCIEVLVLAQGRLTIPDLYRLIISAPMSVEQTASVDWQRSAFCYECLQLADKRPKSGRQTGDYQLAVEFFLTEWPALSDRTRSVVLSSLSSMLDSLQRGVARELLSSPVTNVTPQMLQDGKILIIDLPLLVWGPIGQAIQVIWKYCIQKAQERRDVRANPRPVFMLADESHLLYVSSDQVFQTTARSSRTVTVYATQSISNYFATLGGDRAEAEIHSLLGNMQLQIFHQQFDVKTNEYAAELIGRTRQFFMNSNHTAPPAGLFQSLTGLRDRREISLSNGMSEQLEYEVQPTEFTNLSQGGLPHWSVDAILVQGGQRFYATGRPWMKVTFGQRL